MGPFALIFDNQVNKLYETGEIRTRGGKKNPFYFSFVPLDFKAMNLLKMNGMAVPHVYSQEPFKSINS